MRRLFYATAILAAIGSAALAGSRVHAVTSVAVPLDGVRVIAFTRPVSTLYIGNPVIADVTMIDNRHAFLQGKAFGATNIVALDSNGREVVNRQVVVAGDGTPVVTLQRGTAQTTYTCTASRCEASPVPGDGKDAFEGAIDQIVKHQALLSKAATGEAQ